MTTSHHVNLLLNFSSFRSVLFAASGVRALFKHTQRPKVYCPTTPATALFSTTTFRVDNSGKMGSPSNYRDFIVLGVGGAGASTLYWLTKLAPEKTTLGIEQFEINHKRGSSHDYSRVIRFLYHDASYINFVEDAFACWKELEKDSGRQIYHRCGGIIVSADPNPSPAEEKRFQLYLDAVKPYPALGVKEMTKAEVKQKFPQFDFSKYNSKFLYDPAAGYVEPCTAVEEAVKFVRGKANKNCTILENTKVTGIVRKDNGQYEVHTAAASDDGGVHGKNSQQTFTTPIVFMTAGAWSRDLLSELDVSMPFRVFNEQMSYYGIDPKKIADYQIGKFPVFLQIGSLCEIYGGPVLGDINGLKIATSFGYSNVVPNGDDRTYEVNNDKARATDDFLRTYLPDINPKDNLLHKRCLYTVTPDYEPVIDSLKAFGHPNIYLFAGCGSGFKFTSAIGRAFAEWAIIGKPQVRVPSLLKADRPAIKDPKFKCDEIPF